MTEDRARVEALCRRALEGVLVGATRRADELRATLAAAARAARAQHAKAVQALVADHRERCAREAGAARATAGLQGARALRETRDQLLASFLDQGLARAQTSWERAPGPLAEALAAEGAAQLDLPDLLVRVPAGCRAKLPEDFCARVAARVAARTGRTPNLSLAPGDAPAPGVVVESVDGRVRYDNTLQDRLRRATDLCRARLAALLQEEAPRG